MKIAYLDCFAGISGDMLLGSLINSGLPVSHLQEIYTCLDIADYELVVKEKIVNGLAATKISFNILS